MTNTYNTGNPLGSTDPRDLYDNASNFDEGMNANSPAFTDRLGVLRKSWSGMEAEFDAAQAGRQAEFDAFLVASGYVSLGNYAAGLNFTAYNQYMARDGFFYRPAPSTVPFTTTGTWVGGDEDLFVLMPEDAVLRQDLASTDPAKGAALVAWARQDPLAQVEKVSQALDVLPRSIWEFASAVTVKPDPNDPATWDWYPAFVAVRTYFDANGGTLYIPFGEYRTSNEVRLSSDTSYRCDGTIVLTAPTTGGALIAPYGTSNVSWVGGILDANNIAGQNVIGLAGGGTFPPLQNVSFDSIVCKNAVWDATILGGKGFTLHQGCRGVRYTNILVDDCSLGFSVEGFDGAETSGNIIDGVVVRRATRIGAWLLQGGVVAVDDPNNFSCLIDNIVFEDCEPAAGFGVISADRANGVKLRAFINNYATVGAVTAFKGTITNSRLEIDADINNAAGVLDLRPHTGGQPAADSYNISADVRLVVRTASSGYLVQYNAGSNDLNKADIKVAADNFTGSGLMSAANSSIFFDFIRLADSFRVYGRSEDGSAPTFNTTFREKLNGSFASAGVILTRSSGNTVGIIRAQVTGDQLDLQDAAGSVMVRTKEPASGEVGLLVRNNNGAARLSQVTLGAADSGGAGFKVLRVPN